MGKEYDQYEWMELVTYDKIRILGEEEKMKKPVEMLREVFELCQDEFDVNHMKEKYPEYYRILKDLCDKQLETEEEIFAGSKELVKFFDKHKEEMQKFDSHLYYAVLNFISMLKGKNMYWDILYRD